MTLNARQPPATVELRMPTYDVIGGSRGVGLEIVRQLVRPPRFNMYLIPVHS